MDRYFIYGKTTCPPCMEACRELRDAALEFKFFDLEEDILTEAKEFYNQKTVPIVLKNNKETGIVTLVGGCSDLKEILNV